MNLKKWVPLTLCTTLILGLSSCSKEEEGVPLPGSLQVTVKNSGGMVLEGAEVSTIPTTTSVKTNEMGVAVLKDIPAGTYTVDATLVSRGSASISAIVNPAQSTNAEVELVFGVFIIPRILIDFPFDNEVFDNEGSITITGTVEDDVDSPELLTMSVKSDNNVLGSTTPSSDGAFGITIDNPGIGIHTLIFEAKDTEGRTGSSSITLEIADLPDPVTLSPIQKNTCSNLLTWSKTDIPDFANYKIYRELSGINNQLIETITSFEVTSYEDKNVDLGKTYTYKIGLENSEGRETLSNEESVEAGIGITINDGDFESMFYDKNRALIYAVDPIKNQLLFIDYSNSLVDKIDLEFSPTNLTLNTSGTELFIASAESNVITVIDPGTRTFKRQIIVDTTTGSQKGNPYMIEWMEGDRLVYTVFIDSDPNNVLKLADAQTGELLDIKEPISLPEIITNSEKTILYVSESGTLESQVFAYQVINDKLELISSGTQIREDGFPLSISDDDAFIFSGTTKISANDLTLILGTFPEIIHATNKDGSIAAGENKIYDGNTFTEIRVNPVISERMVMDQNDLLYVHDPITTNIYQIDIKNK